jgi:hypothetical protein
VTVRSIGGQVDAGDDVLGPRVCVELHERRMGERLDVRRTDARSLLERRPRALVNVELELQLADVAEQPSAI